MKLSHLYDQVVRLGSQRDPRPKKAVRSYPDTAILYGAPDTQVENILIGIDIEVAELLLADRIRKDACLDLVISHHPEGTAAASLSEVMQLQVDVLKKIGITGNVAQQLLNERIFEVERRLLAQNHNRAVDAARLLDMPFMCIHTPADNHAFCFVQRLMEKAKPKKVQDILDILMDIPEYQLAEKIHTGPRIILGSKRRPVGKILIEMTGGTEGPRDVFDKLYKAGVRTIISMHLSEEHFKKVKDSNLNVIVAGHISSDALGLNLLLDRIERESSQKFKVIDCSGFNRVSRN